MEQAAVAFIGGSGLYEMDALTVMGTHEVDTPFGKPSDAITEGELAGHRAFFLPRHGKGHQLLAHEINHRANIWALRSLGVRWVISITAVGSLKEEMKPRDVVIPHQLVDRTGRSHEFTFFGNGLAAHVGFADPYSAELRRLLGAAVSAHTDRVHQSATYTCMNGPAFSTRAESEMHRQLGFELIGMTNGSEARLCREAEIAMATMCMVTDYDCWKEDAEAVDVASVIANLQANSELAKNVLETLIPTLPQTPDLPEHDILASSILTPRPYWSEEAIERLKPIIKKYL